MKLCSDCADKGLCHYYCDGSHWKPVNVTLQEKVDAILNDVCDKVDELQAVAEGKQSHYDRFPIQPREYAFVNNLGCVEYNVVKYITRYPFKGDALKDLLKARESIDYLIKKHKEKENE